MDNSHKFIEEDRELIYHQVVSQLPWLLGLWGRVNSFIRGGHSQDNDIKRGGKKKSSGKKKKSKRKVAYQYGVPKKYLQNKKNSKRQVASEIRRTAKAYKQGKKINLKAVAKSRASKK